MRMPKKLIDLGQLGDELSKAFNEIVSVQMMEFDDGLDFLILDPDTAAPVSYDSAVLQQIVEAHVPKQPPAIPLDTINALAARITDLATKVAVLSARRPVLARARVPVPGLALGVAKDVQITWAPPLSEVPDSPPVVVLEAAGTSLGQVTAVVKAGSVTATGCTITLTAPLIVGVGQGFITVFVSGWLN